MAKNGLNKMKSWLGCCWPKNRLSECGWPAYPLGSKPPGHSCMFQSCRAGLVSAASSHGLPSGLGLHQFFFLKLKNINCVPMTKDIWSHNLWSISAKSNCGKWQKHSCIFVFACRFSNNAVINWAQVMSSVMTWP